MQASTAVVLSTAGQHAPEMLILGASKCLAKSQHQLQSRSVVLITAACNQILYCQRLLLKLLWALASPLEFPCSYSLQDTTTPWDRAAVLPGTVYQQQ